MAKVSILMNGYNSERYLKKAIDSVYAQTFDDWEIIFIDNYSTDGTKKIVDGYSEKIKYYKTKKNLNLGSARNFGLRYCCADYLAFLDTDDIWVDSKLEKQVEAMDEDTALVYSSLITIDSNGKDLRKTKINKAPNFPSLLNRYDINMLTVMINLRLIKFKFKFDENLSYCPDYDVFMDLAAQRLKFKSIDIPLARYRIHGNSLSSKTKDIQVKEISIVLNKLQKKYPYLSEEYQELLNNSIIKSKYLIKTKFFLKEEEYFNAAITLLLLSKINKKYLIFSAPLFLPVINRLIYKLIISKYL